MKRNPMFSDEEVSGIREGIDGIKQPLPGRFYCDKDIFELEKEQILKKNWLCVGRWDDVEKPGDYFTRDILNEPIIISRDREGQLHALYNVCQHRWSQVVADGSGNANLFTCPYHRWTYNLDGTLRGVSVQPVPGLDKKKCRMPELRLEEWQGFIFINFDPGAKPLSPQLKSVEHLLERHKMSEYRHELTIDFRSSWNWKFSFENGYEGYHHAGVHNERFNWMEPASGAFPLDFGEICGSYQVPYADDFTIEDSRPFGLPPHFSEDDPKEIDTYVAVYPNLIMYTNSYQVSYMLVFHDQVDSNHVNACQAFAPWTYDVPNSKEIQEQFKEFTIGVQKEDTLACSILQKGIRSQSNKHGVIHPLETQLTHYYDWYIKQWEK